MRGRSLIVQVFVSIVAVALLSVLGAGVMTRLALNSAFEGYLSELTQGHTPMQGMGQGRRMILGAAERAFLDSVDRGMLAAALVAVALAAVVALLVARHLASPLERLTGAAQAVAGGELGRTVASEGPAEVRRLTDAFNEMSRSLLEAEELRRRLVADVAHELRNPVAALRAQAEGMQEGLLEPDPARLASVAEDATHLSRLIEDLQELSLADAGRLRYEMGDVELCSLVTREVSRAVSLVREGVELRADCSQGQLTVRGDEGRLSQVLRNLLANAARHTASGSITVEVRRDAGRATVSVTDTGEGIEAQDLPYVFERFYRADAARAKATGGAGIGLAVSKRIVSDHGGEVFAVSEAGEGATVGFSLPLLPED